MRPTDTTTGKAQLFIEAGSPLAFWQVQDLAECDQSGLLCLDVLSRDGWGTPGIGDVHVIGRNAFTPVYPPDGKKYRGHLHVSGFARTPSSVRRGSIRVSGNAAIVFHGFVTAEGAVHVAGNTSVTPRNTNHGTGSVHVAGFAVFVPPNPPVDVRGNIHVAGLATITPTQRVRGRGDVHVAGSAEITPDTSVTAQGDIHVAGHSPQSPSFEHLGKGNIHVAGLAEVHPSRLVLGRGNIHVAGSANAVYASGDTGVTPGTDCTSAATISLATNYTNNISDPAQHWYKVAISGSTVYHVTITYNSGSVGSAELKTGTSCAFLSSQGTFGGGSNCLSFSVFADSTLYILVNSAFFGSGNYTIRADTGSCP